MFAEPFWRNFQYRRVISQNNSQLLIWMTDDSRMVGIPISFMCTCQICHPLVLQILQHAKDLTTVMVRTQRLMFSCHRNHPSCKSKVSYLIPRHPTSDNPFIWFARVVHMPSPLFPKISYLLNISKSNLNPRHRMILSYGSLSAKLSGTPKSNVSTVSTSPSYNSETLISSILPSLIFLRVSFSNSTSSGRPSTSLPSGLLTTIISETSPSSKPSSDFSMYVSNRPLFIALYEKKRRP